jgi:hypothetical protein
VFSGCITVHGHHTVTWFCSHHLHTIARSTAQQRLGMLHHHRDPPAHKTQHDASSMSQDTLPSAMHRNSTPRPALPPSVGA